MSTNARTWFYTEPEHDAFAIVERLNSTFWAARIGQILCTACMQAEPPFKCRGPRRLLRRSPAGCGWARSAARHTPVR